jgi:hypothetical protein
MDLLELQMLLEEIYELPFLLKIESIFERDRDYKKSEFYKNYKIPLTTLYEKYEVYQRASLDKITSFINNADTEVIVSKIRELLDSIEKEEGVKELINKLLERFDVDQIKKLTEQFQEDIAKIK